MDRRGRDSGHVADRLPGLALALLSALAAVPVLVGCEPVVAQALDPSPVVQAAWMRTSGGTGPRLVLTVSPPAGWALYAPRDAGTGGSGVGGLGASGDPVPGGSLPEGPDGGGPLLGRPLEVVLPRRGPVGIRAARPAPTPKRQAGGRALVYEGPVHLTLAPLPAAVERVEVRWAVCRADRCVPGRSPVSVPPAPPPGD